MGSVSGRRSPPQPWVETPLVESTALSQEAGCRIFLKLENVQPSSSFKIRGLGHLMRSYVRDRPDSQGARPIHFYSSSGGNAGLACVVAASSLGCRASVVVPTSTDDAMVAKLQVAGAREVVVHGDSWADADRFLRQSIIPQAAQDGEDGIYVPPFDHPYIWRGAGSMVEEIHEQLSAEGTPPDAIVCSVGGGGLLAGIIDGIDRVGWTDAVRVIAVETEGADSLAQSVQADRLVTLPGISSVAKSLGATTVAQRALDVARRPMVSTVVIEDAEACAGSWRFADDERFLVEPACGASIALAYHKARLHQVLPECGPKTKVVIVVCGGSRISLALMEAYRQQFGSRAYQLGIAAEPKSSQLAI